MAKLLGCLAVLAILLRAVPVAFADEEWCSDDPPRALESPHGALVLVYETLGAPGDQYAVDLTAALAGTRSTATNYVRDAQGDLGTMFTLSVPVPNDVVLGSFAVQAVVSSGLFGSGTVYASTVGTSGTTLTLVFRYPVP